MRLAAISVDIDEVACYTAIHGLQAPEPAVEHAIHTKALPRFERLFDQQGIAATFFAVGRDLAHIDSAEAVCRLYRKGHEIANHTASHLYDFTRREPEIVRREIEDGSMAIAKVTGAPPVGFRAPGYAMTDPVFKILSELGYAYDSSIFPCPIYYCAKTYAVAAVCVGGGRSASILSNPLTLGAPGDPYRVGTPFWRRGNGLLELPIGVTRTTSLRLPYIGTTVMAFGKGVGKILTRLILGRPLVNLELHGIDLADAEDDGLAFLRAKRPDLRRTLSARQEALLSAIELLRGSGYRFVTLRQAAEELS